MSSETQEALVAEHPFEVAGLGRAPFRCVGVYQIPSQAIAAQNPDAYNNALRMMPRGYGCGTCNFCGQAIMNCYLINSADGRKFAVGCDCVEKTADGPLITKVEAERRRIERERRQAIAAAKREVRLSERGAKAEAARAGCTAANLWLITVLRKHAAYSSFCENIARDLETRTIAEMAFTPRAISILRDIYAKDAGRRGSKAFAAAAAAFDAEVSQ